MIRAIGRNILSVIAEADAYIGEERNQFVCEQLKMIERTYG